MPFESEKQRRAMYAAAAGKGKVGIPQAVARRFIAHAKGKTKRGLRRSTLRMD